MKFSEKHVNLGALVLLGIAVVGLFFRIDSFTSRWNDVSGSFKDIVEILSTKKALPSPSHSPTPYVYEEPTDSQKLYLLALGAILSEQNSENYTVLRSSFSTSWLKPQIEEWWTITDRNSALAVLEWLKSEGHRSEFSLMKKVLVENNVTTCKELPEQDQDQCSDREVKLLHDLIAQINLELSTNTLYAWDMGRLINVARWSYTMGWIDEQEAWTYIIYAGESIQEKYDSWEDYGADYILGRGYWLRDLKGSQQQKELVAYLLNPANKRAWTTINWQTSLKN